MPGFVAVVGLGLPLLIAGSGLKKSARGLGRLDGPALVLRDRRQKTRLELRPAGGPSPWGGGLALRF